MPILEDNLRECTTNLQACVDEAGTSSATTTKTYNINKSPPVSSLPPEILASIFRTAQPRRRLRHKIPFEVVVSHVSSHWRGVILTTPFLWTSIDVYSIPSLVWTQIYLERSKKCPVDVRLDLHHIEKRYNRHSTLLVKNILDVIVPHIDRWRCLLIFTLLEKTAYNILSHFYHLAAPVLQRLTVNVDVGASLDDAHFDSSIFSSAPRLHFVRSEALRCCWLPLSGLTTLHLQRSFHIAPLGYNQLLEIITTPHSLANLSIHGTIDSLDWPIHDSPAFEMNSLRSLQFVGNSTCVSKFLLSVSAPQLHSLWFECSPYENFLLLRESPQTTLGLIKFPALRYLTFQRCDYNYLSRVFPYVSHLHVSYCSTFLQLISFEGTLTGETTSHWPHLHTVAIRTLHDAHHVQTSATISRLVSSRINAGRPIYKLLLDRDLLTILEGVAFLRENIQMELLSTSNYLEPWWIMAHEDPGDRIWAPCSNSSSAYVVNYSLLKLNPIVRVAARFVNRLLDRYSKKWIGRVRCDGLVWEVVNKRLSFILNPIRN